MNFLEIIIEIIFGGLWKDTKKHLLKSQLSGFKGRQILKQKCECCQERFLTSEEKVFNIFSPKLKILPNFRQK